MEKKYIVRLLKKERETLLDVVKKLKGSSSLPVSVDDSSSSLGSSSLPDSLTAK